MAGLIEIRRADVFCSIADGREVRFALAEAVPKPADRAKRRDRSCGRDDVDGLAPIGRGMFAWLDRDGWASAWAGALGDDRIPGVKVGSGACGSERR